MRVRGRIGGNGKGKGKNCRTKPPALQAHAQPRYCKGMTSSSSGASKYVFSFGNGHADGDPKRRDLLGGKGAGLAEMTALGLPVPQGSCSMIGSRTRAA